MYVCVGAATGKHLVMPYSACAFFQCIEFESIVVLVFRLLGSGGCLVIFHSFESGSFMSSLDEIV